MRPKTRPWLRRLVRGTVFLLAMLVLWEAAIRWADPAPHLFPSPAAVARSLENLARQGELLPGIVASIRRMALGYGLSLGIGIFLGLMLASSRLIDETLGAVLLGLQTLPSICWLPMAVLWFGLGEAGILFVVVAGALLAVASGARDAFRNLPPVLLRAGRTLGANGISLWLRVVLPAATPALVSSAKLGWSFAWRSLMAGELLSAGMPGLGQMLSLGRELNDLPRVAAVMIVIVAIGRAVERFGFGPAEEMVARRWGTVAAGG